MLAQLHDRGLRALAWVRRGQRIRNAGAPVRVNLGSGPLVQAKGWINIDASSHLLVRWLPEPLLRRLLALTEVGPDCASTLKRERFVFHDLRNGIPLPDGCADAIFCSHVLEHMADSDVAPLLVECRRVIKARGIVRFVVPVVADDEEDPYEDVGRYLHTHLSRYSWDKLESIFLQAGFARVERLAYRQGHCPGIDDLDNRPESLFVEAYPSP